MAGVVTLAVSLSWIALYTFVPAGDRPYVDGSTNNSAFAMVFGYNGLERFGITIHGAVTSGPGVTTGGSVQALLGGAGSGSGGSGFGSGWTKLLGDSYAPEIGWLYPLAVLALVFGLIWMRRARRDDPVRGGFVMWGIWLLTYFLIFSKMSTIPHTAYVASLAPPLAALPAAGIVMFWRAYRAEGWRGWVLPLAVAAEIAWAAFVWRHHSGFLPWALYALEATGAAAVIALAAARLSRRAGARLVTVGLAAGVAAMLAAPATWAASALDLKYDGSSFDASAGPAGGTNFAGVNLGNTGFAGGSGASAADFGSISSGQLSKLAGIYAKYLGSGSGASALGAFGGISAGAASTTLSASEQKIYNYVSAHRDGARYLMATDGWVTASSYILATGQAVMPMGGFSGSVPEPTVTSVKHLVSTGQLRFFLLSSFGSGGGLSGGSSSGSVQAVSSWVRSTCATVPAKDYTSAAGASGLGALTSGTLYECRA